MKALVTAALGALAITTAAPARAQDGVAQIEAVMGEYLKLWNTYDAGAITRMIYRLAPAHPWSTEAGLKAEFDRLRAGGYSHSDIHSLRGCLTAPDAGQVELKFTRLKTDGSFMPPQNRTSLYRLRRFEDGWRVIGMSALREGQAMDCSPAGGP